MKRGDGRESFRVWVWAARQAGRSPVGPELLFSGFFLPQKYHQPRAFCVACSPYSPGGYLYCREPGPVQVMFLWVGDSRCVCVCVCVCVVVGGEGRGHEFARVRGSSVDLSGSAERCICGFVVDSNSGSTPFVAESSHVSQGDLFSAAQRKRRATRVAPTPLQQQGAFPLKAASQGTLRSFIQCGAQSSTLLSICTHHPSNTPLLRLSPPNSIIVPEDS